MLCGVMAMVKVKNSSPVQIGDWLSELWHIYTMACNTALKNDFVE